MAFDIQTFALSVVTAGGGAAAITAAIMKQFGSKWLESRFSERLEALKHDHAQEMAHLKHRIDHQLDRAVKLNQREFDALPDIWGKIDEAYGQVSSLVSPMRRYPVFSSMNEGQFTETVAKLDLAAWQKAELLTKASDDRDAYYRGCIRWREIHRARKASKRASDAVYRGILFVQPDTFDALKAFVDKMYQTIQDYELRYELKDHGLAPDPNSVSEHFRRDAPAEYDALAKHMRGRFWPMDEKRTEKAA